MTTLRQILENLDKSENNECWVSYGDLAENELYIGNWWADYESPEDRDKKLKCYWIANHLCTDTWVGLRAYFLKGEVVAISDQKARKSSEIFDWVSEEAYYNTKKYLETYKTKGHTIGGDVCLNLDKDMGDGYFVFYSGQFLGKTVLYQGEIWNIDKQYHEEVDKK